MERVQLSANVGFSPFFPDLQCYTLVVAYSHHTFNFHLTVLGISSVKCVEGRDFEEAPAWSALALTCPGFDPC